MSVVGQLGVLLGVSTQEDDKKKVYSLPRNPRNSRRVQCLIIHTVFGGSGLRGRWFRIRELVTQTFLSYISTNGLLLILLFQTPNSISLFGNKSTFSEGPLQSTGLDSVRVQDSIQLSHDCLTVTSSSKQ